MIGKTSVLLITHHALLHDALETLLANNARLRFYQARAWDYRKLLPKIHRHGPVALVVEKEAFGEKIAELASLLLEFDNLQLIVISSVNNDVQVYSSYQATMAIADDLLAIIQPTAVAGWRRRGETAVSPSYYAALHH